MKILLPTIIAKAISVIRHDGIFVYPTDTLYGLGGDATKKIVVEKIYALKTRDKDKPLSIILPSIAAIKKYCLVNSAQEKILKKYLPGPYTFILRLRKNMVLPATNNGKIGVRIPDYQPIVRLCKMIDVPIITTSANISGNGDARRISEVDKKILNAVDFIINAGETKYAEGSTVVDLIDKKILRKGAGKFNIYL